LFLLPPVIGEVDKPSAAPRPASFNLEAVKKKVQEMIKLHEGG